jgi:hypothetical protein
MTAVETLSSTCATDKSSVSTRRTPHDAAPSPSSASQARPARDNEKSKELSIRLHFFRPGRRRETIFSKPR